MNERTELKVYIHTLKIHTPMQIGVLSDNKVTLGWLIKIFLCVSCAKMEGKSPRLNFS